ncbi:hypothetical protein ACFVYR_21325 [Streptomyces sp. NPDC058284]|uniref:hypothetical protein n=1 Tax=unclassified Streptomyces TaxID=2593676 RepID=UPI003669E8B9
MGTLTNGRTTIPYEQYTAPGPDWRKAGRTDLNSILKDCVILADAGVAKGSPHHSIPNGTRLIAIPETAAPPPGWLLRNPVVPLED